PEFGVAGPEVGPIQFELSLVPLTRISPPPLEAVGTQLVEPASQAKTSPSFGAVEATVLPRKPCTVIAPVLAIVASPLIATAVGVVALDTIICASVIAGNSSIPPIAVST